MSAITETELRSFFLNRSITPEGWEIDLLVKLDQLALSSTAKKAPKEQ